MKKRIVLILLAALFVISASLNIVLFNKAKKYERYETAVDSALGYFTSEYRIGSIHRSLEHALSKGKLYFGEPGKLNNKYKSDLQKVGSMHRELTLLYGPLFSYEDYNQISSIGINNLFNMFEDFSMFFENVEQVYLDAKTIDSERQYINLNNLNEEVITGIQIIAEITGKLDSIRSGSYENKTGNDKKALEDYMKNSAAYFHTEDVQKKVKLVENINKKLMSQL